MRDYAECSVIAKRLRFLADDLENAYGAEEGESLFADAAGAIEEMLAVVPHWISVEERLPESVCKSYLCLTDTGYHCEVRWTNNVYGLWKSENKWGWSIADVPQYCKVTHWMPLPEPPKEELNEV